MRVTHVITRLIVGGAQENTVASVLGLRQKAGLELRLVSGPTFGPEGSLESLVAEPPGLLHIEPALVRPIHPWKDLVALRHLIRLFRTDPPDIVHTHSGKAGILGRLAAAQSGVPIIVHTIHGPSFGAFQGFLANSLFRAAERYASKVTTHFVVVADAMKRQYLAAGIGQEAQYSRIFSGFDLEPFLHAKNDPAMRARFGIAPDETVVGIIARLFKLKGHDDLFAVAPDIVAKCPQVKFLLVGGGEWRTRFETLAHALGLTRNFVFTGLVEPSAVAPLVGIMDILVHLSSREGLARALPQALAAGKPVVAYDCDGAREVCLEDKTGFLVNRGDLTALQGRLFHLVADKQLRQRLGQHGRSFVSERFGVQQMVDALHTLYLDLTRKHEDPRKQRSAWLPSLSNPV
jgi:glycosyltransferase involved in cell wall biosynthesis